VPKKLTGYADLLLMAIHAEAVARNAYQADAYAVAGSDAFAEVALERTLAAAHELSLMAAKIREARRGS